jgi:hypothetical protein
LIALADGRTGFSCSNNDFEITCTTQRCEVTIDDGFTPMSVTVSSGHFEVCAYSGCWIGSPKLLSVDDVNFVAQGDLVWRNTPSEVATRMNLVIDTESGVGFFMGAGFSQPMQCRPWECEEDCSAD